jgi:hypothetical protein
MKTGQERGAERIVRLYGYNLNHATPYLVYEFLPDGSLAEYLLARRRIEASPTPDVVLGWIVQILEGLAFAHQRGLVHRDLKPANVLRDGDALKLGDFGLGGMVPIVDVFPVDDSSGTQSIESVRSQAVLFRGAGTPLYMSPEQRRGDPPDPRHDLYSLGVLWYQLLIGDVTQPIHPGWSKELTVHFMVPVRHVQWIERCVSHFEYRPQHAGELLATIRAEAPGAGITAPAGAQPLRCPACGRRALPRQKTCHYCYTPMVRHNPPPVLNPNQNPCPSCKAAMKPGAVICLECGYDTRTGQRVRSDTKKKRETGTVQQHVPAALRAYGYVFMIIFGGLALLNLVGMCLFFLVPFQGIPAEVKAMRREVACSGTLNFLVLAFLATGGDALRKGQRRGIMSLLLVFLLCFGGGVIMVLPVLNGRNLSDTFTVGVATLATSAVIFLPPIVIGFARWRQLE